MYIHTVINSNENTSDLQRQIHQFFVLLTFRHIISFKTKLTLLMMTEVILCCVYRSFFGLSISSICIRMLRLLVKLKFHWDRFLRNFPVAKMLRGSRQLVTRKSGVSPACYEDVSRKLATFRPSQHVKMVWRRRQQVREEVTGKQVPVEFELKRAAQPFGPCWALRPRLPLQARASRWPSCQLFQKQNISTTPLCASRIAVQQLLFLNAQLQAPPTASSSCMTDAAHPSPLTLSSIAYFKRTNTNVTLPQLLCASSAPIFNVLSLIFLVCSSAHTTATVNDST